MNRSVKYVRVKRSRDTEPVDNLVISHGSNNMESSQRSMNLAEGVIAERSSPGVIYKLVATLPMHEEEVGKRSKVEHTNAYHAGLLKEIVKLGDERVEFIDVSLGSQHGISKKEGVNSLDILYGSSSMQRDKQDGQMLYSGVGNGNFIDESTMAFLDMMMHAARDQQTTEEQDTNKDGSAFHKLKALKQKEAEEAHLYDVYEVQEDELDAFEMKKLQFAHVLDIGQLQYLFKEQDDGQLVHDLIEPDDREHSDVDSLEYDYEDEPSSSEHSEYREYNGESSDDGEYGMGYEQHGWNEEDE